MKTQRRIVRNVTKNETTTSQLPKAEHEVLALAKELIQLSALRLSLSKQEEERKKKINDLMVDNKLHTLWENITIQGQKVSVKVEMKSRQISSLDLDKLTAMLTPEQFKECAKVTLTDARKVLPGAMVDQCITLSTSDPSVSVSADKGYPVPEVELLQ